MQRRDFLRGIAASTTSLIPSFGLSADFTKPVPEADGLTSYQKDGSIQVRRDNLPALAYRAQSSLKYPYFSPLNGPVSGLSLTTESSLPYPHHRGLWLGCDPLNGGNYWADNGLASGQIKSVELKLGDAPSGENTITFSERCIWERDGSNPFKDERLYRIEGISDHRMLIDCAFKLTASEDVRIKKAKHSFFAMRAAADISPSYGGTMINSNGGINAVGTYGKTADWCGYFGKRQLNPEVTEGIVIMNHPDNFGGNCPWFTRDYGHLSPSPFNFRAKPWTIEKGRTLTLSYRVVLFAGTPREAGVDALYRQWVA